jgi:tetratricopeptide (TPR) repeat protein
VLAVAAVTVALLVGSAVAVWQAVVANRAKQTALDAAAAEKTARELAQTRAAETRTVLDFVRNHILAAARPKGRPGGLGHDVTLRAALVAALPVVDKSFANQPLVEAQLRMTLGMSFLYLSEPRTAAEQFRRARALYSQHLGADHRDTLESMYYLASSYADAGRYDDALELRKETLALQQAHLGPSHSDTLRSMRNLANSYADRGQDKEALEIDEQVVPLLKDSLGEDHEETLAAMNNLAMSYRAVGRHKDALGLFQKVLAVREAKGGAGNPDVVATMNNLAITHSDLREYDKALDLLLVVVDRAKAGLGPNHRDTLRYMHNLANAYGFLEDHAKALEIHRETLKRRVEHLGPNHPDTFGSEWGVAAKLLALNRGPEAILIIDECLLRAARQSEKPNLLGLADLRLRYFKKAGDAVGCRRTAELWEAMQPRDVAGLYGAASMRAVTAAVFRAEDKSAEAAKKADSEADRAMAWLHKAVAAGYQNATQLKQDKDLDALRDRADFQELLARVPSEN